MRKERIPVLSFSMPKMAFNVLLELYHELFKSVQKYGEKNIKKGSIFKIEPVLLYVVYVLYMFRVCSTPLFMHVPRII